MLMAEITGEARHRAKWRDLTSDQEAAAVGALRELAAGPADLLAEVAGIFEGASEGRHDEPPAPVRYGPMPQGRSRRQGDPGADRGGPPTGGAGKAAAVHRRPAGAVMLPPTA
jgi:hypothetical protein